MRGVYILHLDTPLEHARHYTGFAHDLAERIPLHGTSRGARIMQVCQERGITWRLGRIFEDGDRRLERRFKKTGHAAARCAICNPTLDLTVAVPYSYERTTEDCPF
jgi:predicted GIY-YIG superfamily endonuclease